MTKCIAVAGSCLFALSAWAEVRVYVEDVQGVAWLRYQCTAGELVRAFALDVAVDRGTIRGVSDYHRGESTAGARGYGVFPASFRDRLTVTGGTNVNWEAERYSPVAAAADAPSGTLPGLNSSGVTLEFGALWDPSVPAAVPGTSGTLCAIHLSKTASVSLAANSLRGGIVPASADATIRAVFVGARVEASPVITDTFLAHGILTVQFRGGELETAPAVTGPWTGTGSSGGQNAESVAIGESRFFRVRRP